MNETKILYGDAEAIGPTIVGGGTLCLLRPLGISWQPKEDITTYELAMCIPILIMSMTRPIMPYDVKSEPYMRHFTIHDPNKKP